MFVVRKGNPDNIQSWDDLISPASRSSRRTRSPRAAPAGTSWPPTARRSSEGKSPEEALDYLVAAARQRCGPAESASDALATFTSGKGDVLLSYENEAIAAQKAGEDVDYVVPDDTILIETPVADHDRRLDRRRRTSSTTCDAARPSSSGPTAATGRWTSRC